MSNVTNNKAYFNFFWLHMFSNSKLQRIPFCTEDILKEGYNPMFNLLGYEH